MLTGFFSDVHGDLASLRRALDLLQAADEIVFLGDVAGGRESCECIRVMQERKIKAVKGNHDMWLFEQVGLPQDCVEALSRLPLRLAGEGFVAIHSLYTADNGEARFRYVRTHGEVDELLQQQSAPTIFIGHTHEPALHQKRGSDGKLLSCRLTEDFDFLLDSSNRHVVNVGSADSCVVLYNTVSRTLSYRFVKDDHTC